MGMIKLVTALLATGFIANATFAQVQIDGPRRLAPGVLKIVRDANIDDATLDKNRPFSELLSVVQPQAWSPNFDPQTETLREKASNISFQREVWSLEFGCKSLRVIKVNGKNIWYLIYFVRNVGEARSPSLSPDKSIEIRGRQKPVRFIPSLVLQAHDLNRAYRDRVRRDVIEAIAAKERVTRGQLHDSASISKVPIEVSSDAEDRRVWGVATWDNVDPDADLVSVFVQGLTNAYRWTPPPSGYRPDNALREQDVVQSKTLQLTFWRSGDAEDLHDTEIAFGIPLYPDQPDRQQQVLEAYNLDKPIEHRWVYR